MVDDASDITALQIDGDGIPSQQGITGELSGMRYLGIWSVGGICRNRSDLSGIMTLCHPTKTPSRGILERRGWR